MLGQSLTKIVRKAEAEIERHKRAQHAPQVIWQRPGQSLEEFDVEVIAYRNQLPSNASLLAICEPHPQPIDGVMLCELTKPMLELQHGSTRNRVLYGGRARGASWGFVRVAIVRSLEKPLRFLCGRETQSSIADSVHRTLKDQIGLLGLERWFDVQETAIIGANGSEFIFMGLRNDPLKVKSTEGIDVLYVEEAQKVSDASWQTAIPTIRKPGSQIWVNFNPDLEDDPTYERFITNTPPNSKVIKSTWRDNPWLSAESIEEKDYLARVDADNYQHVWEGFCRTHSEAQVFAGKFSIEAFEPGLSELPRDRRKDTLTLMNQHAAVAKLEREERATIWDGPYYGADWGFSVDPSVIVRCWIHKNRLYVEYESYGIGVETIKLPELFEKVPGAREHVCRADNSRPENISHMNRHGFPRMTAAAKWPGCVEDGVGHLRGYEQIIIHPRCTHAAEECRLFSYKLNRAGDVMPELKTGWDHVIDAIRYSLQPFIRQRRKSRFTPLNF